MEETADRFSRVLVTIAALAAALLLAAVALWLSQAPAEAATTPWKCGLSGCKYSQVRAKYNGTTLQQVQIWGSTASGDCDESNNITRWQIEKTSLIASSLTLWSWGPSVWYTNCTIDNSPPPPSFWTVTANKTFNPCCSNVKTTLEFDSAQPNSDFFETIYNSL